MKKITSILLGLLLLVNFSCSDYLDVNNNVDTPEWVEPHLRLASIQSAYEGMLYDMRAVGPLCQFMGTSSTTYDVYAKHGFVVASDAAGETWRFVYWLQGMNLENLINDAIAREEYTLAGIGYAIKAYSWNLLANINGDAILDDAFVPGKQTHRYNSQEEIYNAARKWAFTALEYFDKVDNTAYGDKLTTNDLVYKGNKSQWVKFTHAVLARHYLCYSNKTDFLSGKNYADSVIYHADQSFISAADDAKVRTEGETSANSHFYGVRRENLSNTYTQSDYAVQVLTGTIPQYDAAGTNIGILAPQIVTDAATLDPRACLLLGTASTGNPATYVYTGARPGAGSLGGAANFFGLNTAANTSNAGSGRWMYRDNAPIALTSYAEIQLCKAEAAYLKNDQATALIAFKNGVAGHMDFCESYISSRDKVTTVDFRTAATTYLASQYVNGINPANFSLSHIMMQKWVALFPWSLEAWTDIRRYNYDLVLGASGVPESGISYTTSRAYHKDDTDPTRVYKGFYIPSADVQGRRMDLDVKNQGAPCYRLRPRYNSEYMWNKPSLEGLTPIPGTADNYQTSIMWFSKPGN